MEKVNLQERRIGIHAIEKFTVTEKGAMLHNLDMLQHHQPHRMIEPGGTYTRLVRFDGGEFEGGRTVVMSDTPAEMADHVEAVKQARGKVVINGLGIGMVLNAVLAKPEVESVLVIEYNEDVIALTADQYAGNERVTIVQDDAYQYTPQYGSRYDMVWHDIWDHICPDNIELMDKLEDKWRPHAAWQGSWARDECEKTRDRIERARQEMEDTYRALREHQDAA